MGLLNPAPVAMRKVGCVCAPSGYTGGVSWQSTANPQPPPFRGQRDNANPSCFGHQPTVKEPRKPAMSSSLPSFSGTQGSAAIEAVLESIRDELLPELDALRSVFQQEVAPRAKRIGDLLARAQGNFARNLDFYDWANTAVGLKQRQIRSYIRFSQRLAAIEAAADDQGVPISSIEQGLALLTPAPEEDRRTDEEVRVAAVAQATGRAKGALTRAMDAIYDLTPGGLSPDELRLFQELGDLLTRWGSTTTAPSPAVEALASVADRHIEATAELAVDRQEWTDPQPTTHRFRHRLKLSTTTRQPHHQRRRQPRPHPSGGRGDASRRETKQVVPRST